MLGVKPTTEADEMLMSRYARIKIAFAVDIFMSQLLIAGVVSVQVQGGCGGGPWSWSPTADQGHRHGWHGRRGSHASNARYVHTRAAKPPVSYCITASSHLLLLLCVEQMGTDAGVGAVGMTGAWAGGAGTTAC